MVLEWISVLFDFMNRYFVVFSTNIHDPYFVFKSIDIFHVDSFSRRHMFRIKKQSDGHIC